MHFIIMQQKIEKEQFKFTSSFQYFFYLFNAFQFYFLLYNFAFTLILSGSLGVILIFSFFILFKKSYEFLVNNKNRHYLTHYKKFQFIFVSLLRLFFHQNNWLGKAFTLFVILNVPPNAYLITWIFLGDNLFTWKVLNFVVFTVQILCIFGFHLAISEFTNLISKFAKPLIKLIVYNQNKTGSLRYRLKVTNEIYFLHSQNRLGMTYGKIGLITINSFIKFTFYYVKFIFIFFKIHRYG